MMAAEKAAKDTSLNGSGDDHLIANPPTISLEESQNAANCNSGPRYVPGRFIPVPQTVSKSLQETIAAPYRSPAWDANAPNDEAWDALIAKLAIASAKTAEEARELLNVTVEPTVIDGVKAYIVTPKVIPEQNKNRLLVNTHGGGYIYNPGFSSTLESILMAGFGGFKCIAVDYRMPPDHPFPAGLDDALTIWKAALKMVDNPANVGLFGGSAGAGMAMATVLYAHQQNIPLPAAVALGTPWSDLTESGDTFKTNEWLDNVLVSYGSGGYLARAAKLYADGQDLTNPLISPLNGDLSIFPPTILTSGTRDLFLSLTVLTHRKLRRAGVLAELNVFEGMSHYQFLSNHDSEESKESMADWTRFFDTHLGK